MRIVEIFKTDVKCKQASSKVLAALDRQLPHCLFNFDLDDPESILRAEVKNCLMPIECILDIVSHLGIEIALIAD